MLSNALLGVISAFGAFSFVYPFFLARVDAAGPGAAHAATAPIIVALLGPALLALLVAELGARRLNGRVIAVLGVLTAITAVLRLPAGPGDSPTFFFLPILAGFVYGAHFGFLLGALALFVSALLTGGVGPWMPFQMFVTGWMGLSAGLLGHAIRGLRPGGYAEIGLLAVFGYLWGFLFGALMNLWSWPFAGLGPLNWQPGLGLPETLRRYLAFYLVTSLSWDALRAIGNVVLIVALARPILKELRRFRDRFYFRVE